MDHNEPAIPSDERLQQIVSLATTLSEQVLDAKVMGRPIPDQQIRALGNASLLLEESSIELPSLLKQVLHEIGPAQLAAAVAAGSPQIREP